ncbi:hypothetical protein INR49_021451 [Caranx melampygus]|nr:hypothetical protein INR49_021451 [Caranx melampygus]
MRTLPIFDLLKLDPTLYSFSYQIFTALLLHGKPEEKIYTTLEAVLSFLDTLWKRWADKLSLPLICASVKTTDGVSVLLVGWELVVVVVVVVVEVKSLWGAEISCPLSERVTLYVLAKRPNTAPQNQHWRDYIAAWGGGGWWYGSKNKLNQAEGEKRRTVLLVGGHHGAMKPPGGHSGLHKPFEDQSEARQLNGAGAAVYRKLHRSESSRPRESPPEIDRNSPQIGPRGLLWVENVMRADGFMGK